MTVKELIEALKKIDNQDRIVVMSKDGEGNSYSPLADFGEVAYIAESTWDGTVGPEELTDEMRKDGWEEDDIIEGDPAIVFYPTN